MPVQVFPKTCHARSVTAVSRYTDPIEVPIDSELFSPRCKRIFLVLRCQLSTDAQHLYRRPAISPITVMRPNNVRFAPSALAGSHAKTSRDHVANILSSLARWPQYFRLVRPRASRLAAV